MSQQPIEMQMPGRAFAECWQAAALHLQHRGQKAFGWLKADLSPPFLEHLSFRMGNQLVFVRVVDAGGRVKGPGTIRGLTYIAQECNGHACILPMRRSGEGWRPERPDWGLLSLTGAPFDPVAEITDEPIEMTHWEKQDFAVQVVRDHVVKAQGFELMSSQGNPAVDPSIWFVGKAGPEFIVVRYAVFPETTAARPENLADVAGSCAHMSRTGHFASVSFGMADGSFDEHNPEDTAQLLRGHGVYARFDGLEPIGVRR